MALSENRIDRRQFLKTTAVAGIGYVIACSGCRKQERKAMEKQIAACGLDCNACPFPDIHKDLETAKKWVGPFREWKVITADEGAEEIMAKGPYCLGCHGDRSKHWSANCWILKCCVDDKGLDNCSQCDDFLCDKLVEWSKEKPEYGKAIDNLRQLKQGG